MQESCPEQAEAFPLLVAINNRNNQIVTFLWNDLRPLWDSFHLEYIIEEMSAQKYLEGIKIILRSPTSHEIYMAMRA
jgi:hypothetical protein